MTVYQTLSLIGTYYKRRLNRKDRLFVNNMLDGLSGLGDISDVDVVDYISDAQIKYIRDIGKRFLITKHSKLNA